MANKSENAEIAVLQTQMADVQQTVSRIETKLDNQMTSYLTKDEFITFKKQYWLSHSLTAVLVAGLTALLFWFFNHK